LLGNNMNKVKLLLSFGVMYFGVMLNGNIEATSDEALPADTPPQYDDPLCREILAELERTRPQLPYCLSDSYPAFVIEYMLTFSKMLTMPGNHSNAIRNELGALDSMIAEFPSVGRFIIGKDQSGAPIHIRTWAEHKADALQTPLATFADLPLSLEQLRNSGLRYISDMVEYMLTFSKLLALPDDHMDAIYREFDELRQFVINEEIFVAYRPGLNITLHAWAATEAQKALLMANKPQEEMIQVLEHISRPFREGTEAYLDEIYARFLCSQIFLFFSGDVTTDTTKVREVLLQDVDLLQQRIFNWRGEARVPSGYSRVIAALSNNICQKQVLDTYTRHLVNFREAIMSGNNRKVVSENYMGALSTLRCVGPLRQTRVQAYSQHLKEICDCNDTRIVPLCKYEIYCLCCNNNDIAIAAGALDALRREAANDPRKCSLYAELLMYLFQRNPKRYVDEKWQFFCDNARKKEFALALQTLRETLRETSAAAPHATDAAAPHATDATAPRDPGAAAPAATLRTSGATARDPGAAAPAATPRISGATAPRDPDITAPHDPDVAGPYDLGTIHTYDGIMAELSNCRPGEPGYDVFIIERSMLERKAGAVNPCAYDELLAELSACPHGKPEDHEYRDRCMKIIRKYTVNPWSPEDVRSGEAGTLHRHIRFEKLTKKKRMELVLVDQRVDKLS
jgi:hypothetical protein